MTPKRFVRIRRQRRTTNSVTSSAQASIATANSGAGAMACEPRSGPNPNPIKKSFCINSMAHHPQMQWQSRPSPSRGETDRLTTILYQEGAKQAGKAPKF
jgi:hypothetical protein